MCEEGSNVSPNQAVGECQGQISYANFDQSGDGYYLKMNKSHL